MIIYNTLQIQLKVMASKRALNIATTESSWCKRVKLFTSNNIEYLPRSCVKNSVCSFKKLENGRYYVSVNDYLNGRKIFWQRKFSKCVKRLIKKRKALIQRWCDIVNDVIHRQRCKRLISQLRGLINIKQSKLYKLAKKELTCPCCKTFSMKYAQGPCRCHRCEDWFGCGGGFGEDLLRCDVCKFTRTITRTRCERLKYVYKF